jgi:hypothetical protein
MWVERTREHYSLLFFLILLIATSKHGMREKEKGAGGGGREAAGFHGHGSVPPNPPDTAQKCRPCICTHQEKKKEKRKKGHEQKRP